MSLLYPSPSYRQAPLPLVKYRIESIDILRGLIMLIMALDHTRDFFHFQRPDPTFLQTTTPLLFFTRWITHFCAPLFVFLSGISANLAGVRRTKKQLSIFLLKRGCLLLIIEFVLITFGISFNPFYNVFIFQVIGVIGGSMILMAGVIWLPLPVIMAVGALLFFGHDLTNYIDVPHEGTAAIWWKLLFTASGSLHPISAGHFVFLYYTLLPWTGVMLLGYTAGILYRAPFHAVLRRKILYLAGGVLVALFLLLRVSNGYGDPVPWTIQKTQGFSLLSFFNVSKYPPSLIYLCMTIGPGLVLLATIELMNNKFTAILKTYGTVPLFYYILHIYLLRIFNVILFFIQGFSADDIITPNQIFLFCPPAYGLGIGGVYLVWLMVIGILYFPCRWYSNYKKDHQQWWLSYL